MLGRYDELRDLISMLGIDEFSAEDRQLVGRAQRLRNFLTQPFFVAEPFTGMPGRNVPPAATVDGVPPFWKGAATRCSTSNFHGGRARRGGAPWLRAPLHFVIRTPQDIVLECDVASVRVPTETGQVGLRPHSEPTVLAVEPGLIVVRQDDLIRFAGTAGGLLHCDGAVAHLLTPVAVIGDCTDHGPGSTGSCLGRAQRRAGSAGAARTFGKAHYAGTAWR